ncbi:MAG: hypothetical protein ACXWG9_09010 [Usitatibacter sp.]
MTPQSLEPPTDYRTTVAVRVGYALLAVGALAFAASLPFVLALRTARPPSWIEWLFVTAVALPALALAIYSGVRAIQASARLHVTDEGFVYQGVLREYRAYWILVATATWSVNNARLLTLELWSDVQPTLRLDLTGLSPRAFEFMRQVHRFAPLTLVAEPRHVKQIRKLVPEPRPRYATPEEIPDFDKMRAEVEEVATGKDREDLLRNLDDLEREWKSRLDPSLQPPRKSP